MRWDAYTAVRLAVLLVIAFSMVAMVVLTVWG